MVKKLFKYEWISARRFLVPLSLVVIGLSVIARLMYLFDVESITSEPIALLLGLSQGLATTFNVLAIGALFLISQIMLVVRFYRNIVGQEGYLTLTLPVTPGTHVLVKTVFSVLVSLWNVILTMCALLLLGIGTETENDILLGIAQGFDFLTENAGGVNVAFYLLEALLLVVVFFFFQFSLFYACIAVGQQMKKHRVLGALLSYAAWYIFKQILGVVTIVSVTIFSEPLERFLETILLHFDVWMHIGFAVVIVVYAALSVAFFLVSRFMLTKKLNLE